MKLEGGSFVKSPWYHRTGSRPVGANPYLYYDGAAIGSGFAKIVRASATPTTTLGLYLGAFSSSYVSAGVGTNAYVWIGLTMTGLTLPFAGLLDYNGATTGLRVSSQVYCGMAMWDSAYSIEISTYDNRTGSTFQGKAALHYDYYGK